MRTTHTFRTAYCSTLPKQFYISQPILILKTSVARSACVLYDYQVTKQSDLK